MFKSFKSQQISMQLMLPVFGILPYLSCLIWPDILQPEVHNVQGMSYSAYRSLLASHPVALMAGSWFFLSLFSSWLYWVNIRFEIISQRTVIVSYMYFLLVSVPMNNLFLHPGLIAAMFLFASLVSLFVVYGKSVYEARIFNSGLLFGLSVLLYPPFVILLPLLLLAIARMKQPLLRDFAVLLLGLMTTLWLYGGILYLTGQLEYEWIAFKQWFQIRDSRPFFLTENPTIHLIYMIWLLLMLPMSLTISGSRKDTGRRVISVIGQLLWLSTVIFILFDRVSGEIWALISLPLAFLFSMAIMNSRQKWKGDLIFLGLFTFLIAFQVIRIFRVAA